MNKKQKKTSERNQAGINSLTATPPKGEDSIRCVGGVNKHEMELDE